MSTICLFERGIDICHETVRFWWNRFGPMFASDIGRQRISRMKGFRHWRWHLDEVFVKINGETHYLWRAVDHEGEILESYVNKEGDKIAALRFLKKALRRHGLAEQIVTDGLRSYPAAMRDLGNLDLREIGRWLTALMTRRPFGGVLIAAYHRQSCTGFPPNLHNKRGTASDRSRW